MEKGASEREEDLQHLLYYCKKNSIKKAIFIYSGAERTEQRDGVGIHKIPFWKVTKESVERVSAHKAS